MKESVFQGRSLLAEKDFTKEELQYLLVHVQLLQLQQSI